jgi:ATP-dependent DNA helicase RecG
VGALFFRVNDEDVEFRHAGIVCALYKGVDKVYVLDAKELNRDIISNIDDAVVFLKKHLRISFKIETLRRENILELPEDALREAIINAACHRDYFEKGARVMVEIFDDRVDIVSPGGVPKGITPENFGTISITRNSVIASMLYRIDYIEEMGTGIRRMRNAAQEANVAEPEFNLTGFFKVTFKRNEHENSIGRQSVANRSQSVVKRLPGGRQATVASDTQATLNRSPIGRPADTQADRKQIVILFLEEHGQAKAVDFMKVIGLSDGRVRALLRQMASDGTVKKIGDNRYAYYVLK